MRNNSGKAMIIAIITMAVMTTFSLIILLAASALFNNTRHIADSEQCRIMAVSLSEHMEKEIVSAKPVSMAEERELSSSVWYYIKRNIIDSNSNWPYYNEEERGHTSKFAFKKFDISSDIAESDKNAETLVGDSEVIMYWESERGADIDGSSFYVVVTCTSGGKSCTITNEFKMEKNELVYTNDNGEVVDRYEQWLWSFNNRE